LILTKKHVIHWQVKNWNISSCLQ